MGGGGGGGGGMGGGGGGGGGYTDTPLSYSHSLGHAVLVLKTNSQLMLAMSGFAHDQRVWKLRAVTRQVWG